MNSNSERNTFSPDEESKLWLGIDMRLKECKLMPLLSRSCSCQKSTWNFFLMLERNMKRKKNSCKSELDKLFYSEFSSSKNNLKIGFETKPVRYNIRKYFYCLVKGNWASLVTWWWEICLPVQEMKAQSLGREDPLEKEMATTPVFLPGKSHGQRAWWATVHRVSKSWTW